MSTVTVYPNGDGTKGAWVDASSGTSNLYTNVDEGTASPNDSDYIKCSTASNAIFFELGDMPADFGTILSISITVRARRDTSKGDFRAMRGFRIYKSDETTALTADTTTSSTTSFADYNGTPTITGAGDKASWDGARIKIDTNAGTTGAAEVSAIQVTITYMAVIKRYFSTSSAGAADGTSWADRAQFINAGTLSTVLTGFNFTADSLVAYVGPGTYTFTSALASGTFTSTAPSAAFPCILHGCDSSGNALTAVDPNWTADLPSWDDSGLPVFATTTNVSTITVSTVHLRHIKLTASGATGNFPVNGCGLLDWCSLSNTTSNTAAIMISSCMRISNCIVDVNASSYRAGIVWGGATIVIHNTKLTGVTSSSGSGNRHGIEVISSATGGPIHQCCVSGFGGDGIRVTSATASHYISIRNCVLANNGGNGAKFPSTASQTNINRIDGSMITGNGVYGVDAQSAARVSMTKTRLRDNTSGNLNGFASWPTDLENYTTDSDDSTEYVAAGSNNFQVKSGAAIHGYGYGISEEASAGGGSNNTGLFVGHLGLTGVGVF